MSPDKKYVTQVTKADLREIAAVTNIEAGDGVELVRGDHLVVRIDKEQLKRWMWHFWKNGGFSASANVAETSIDQA